MSSAPGIPHGVGRSPDLGVLDFAPPPRTFEDDCVRIDGRFYSCEGLGLSWPPPERLLIVHDREAGAIARVDEHPAAVEYRRVSCSAITDEQRAEMTRVFRAADYEAETDA